MDNQFTSLTVLAMFPEINALPDPIVLPCASFSKEYVLIGLLKEGREITATTDNSYDFDTIV